MKLLRLILILAFCIQVSACVKQADATSVTMLTWTAPTTYENGTPADPTAIAGYVIYWGIAPATYTNNYQIAGNTTSVLLSSIFTVDGTYYMVVKAIDALGYEGKPSLELQVTITQGQATYNVLSAPTNFKAQ